LQEFSLETMRSVVAEINISRSGRLQVLSQVQGQEDRNAVVAPVLG